MPGPERLGNKAKDFSAFEAAYDNTIQSCNGCHQAMGYGFITVTKLDAPPDNGVNYTNKSEPGDVPPRARPKRTLFPLFG
jgi:hypothetical protein